MGNTGGNGNRRGTSKHEQEAWLRNYPPCPACDAREGDVCRTPAGRPRAPHQLRSVCPDRGRRPADHRRVLDAGYQLPCRMG